ncbi:MAG: NAD(P)-dependent oxidoreductase [Oscillospiraceae bacterium]
MAIAVITGASGMLGSTLVELLANDGCKVYAAVREGSKKLVNIPKKENIDIVECSLENLWLLKKKIPVQCDMFFHFAWGDTFGKGRNDMDSQIANISYTIDAVRVANALNCKVFVGAGSQAEYGRSDGKLTLSTACFPENGYGMAKLCAGQMSRTECEAFGMRHVWARILSVYGPRDNAYTLVSSTVRKLLKGEMPALTKGEQMWDYIYSLDAAKALCLMAQKGVHGAVYPLGSGNAMPLHEYMEILRDMIDEDLPLGFGVVPYADRQVMHLQADISALTHDTGFVPQVGFKEGISETIKWIRGKQNE